MNIEETTGEKGRKAFVIGNEGEELGRMEFGIKDGIMTVYHTEISPKAEGKGLAKELLNHMAAHARANHVKVNPLCQFVHLQFKRRPDAYKDLWTPDGTGSGV